MSQINITTSEVNSHSADDNPGVSIEDLITSEWDPMLPEPARTPSNTPLAAASALYLARIKKDILSLNKDCPPGIFVVPDEDNLTIVHALVIGVDGTPYDGGFFYFLIRFSSQYPIKPPLVRLMTTDAGRVRFNPNLYRNGKVCLSLLGTWPGPSWSPSLSLSSLLVTVQSLLSDKPYHNEPGYELKELATGDSDKYNLVLQHETLRVAVCGMLENETSVGVPEPLRAHMCAHFLRNYQHYRDLVARRLDRDGLEMEDPFREMAGRFDHAAIGARMTRLCEKLSRQPNTKDASIVSGDVTDAVAPPPSHIADDDDAVRKLVKQTQTDAAVVKHVGDANELNFDESKQTQTDADNVVATQTDEYRAAVEKLTLDDAPVEVTRDDSKETQTEAYFNEVRQIRSTQSDEKQTQTEVDFSDLRVADNMAGSPIGIC